MAVFTGMSVTALQVKIYNFMPIFCLFFCKTADHTSPFFHFLRTALLIHLVCFAAPPLSRAESCWSGGYDPCPLV